MSFCLCRGHVTRLFEVDTNFKNVFTLKKINFVIPRRYNRGLLNILENGFIVGILIGAPVEATVLHFRRPYRCTHLKVKVHLQ